MTRIKLFKSVESELDALVADVNDWIESVSYTHLTLPTFYSL